MTREIGSVFNVDGVELKVEREMNGNACVSERGRGCYFLYKCLGAGCGSVLNMTGLCWEGLREDHESVVFIKQEKGGDK